MTQDQAPIDLAWLLSATAHDTPRTRLVLGLFAAETAKDLDRLLRAADRERWQNAAHALKSSAAAVGATALLRLANEAQYLGEADWKSRRATLEDEFKRVVDSARTHAVELMARSR